MKTDGVHLNACLHCGGEAEVRKYTGEIGFVRCRQCGIQTPFLKAEEAIIRWNAKVKEDKPDGD